VEVDELAEVEADKVVAVVKVDEVAAVAPSLSWQCRRKGRGVRSRSPPERGRALMRERE
jgi:hypothetical protein